MSHLIKSDKPDDGPIADLIRTRAVAIAIFVAVMTASILVLDGISSSDDPPSLGLFSIESIISASIMISTMCSWSEGA